MALVKNEVQLSKNILYLFFFFKEICERPETGSGGYQPDVIKGHFQSPG